MHHSPVLLGRGELDSQTALELSTLTRAWISARHEREELQLKLTAQHGHPNQVIRIEGGLPRMPGHENLVMPDINGASGQGGELNGKTIDLEKNAETLPAPDVDDQTTEPQDPTDMRKNAYAGCPRHGG